MAAAWIAADVEHMLEDFGESVTLNGVSVTAIFDAEGEVAGAGFSGAAVYRPMLTLATSDVPASPIGKTAVVGGVSYTVAEHRADGTGVSTLVLERA